MEPKIFIAMVAQMRLAQKQYLRTRKTLDAAIVKDLQQQVDAAIRGYEKRDNLIRKINH